MTGQADSYRVRYGRSESPPLLPAIERAAALTLTTFSDVPWNGPYYGRLGFHTLDLDTLSPALQKVWEVETAVGLPMTHRICMQLDL